MFVSLYIQDYCLKSSKTAPFYVIVLKVNLQDHIRVKFKIKVLLFYLYFKNLHLEVLSVFISSDYIKILKCCARNASYWKLLVFNLI